MSIGLQVLEEFIHAANGVRSVQDLCELGAATAVRLARAEHAMTWIVDQGVSPSAHLVGVAGLEARPAEAPTEWPTLIEQAMTHEGTSRRTDVQRGVLGLPSGAPFASVDWVTVRRSKTLACWVGVLSSQAGYELDQDRSLLLQIMAQQLALLHQTMSGDSHPEDDEFRYRRFVEELPAMTYARGLDTPGTAEFISPQSMALLGYSPEEFVGNRNLFEERLHPEDRERVLKQQTEHDPGDTTTIRTVTYRMIHKEGHVVWLLNHLRTVRAEDGSARFITGLLIDVSEPERRARENAAHAAEEEELRRIAQLENQAKSSFLASMSHELRTPLNGILGTCEALQEGVYGALTEAQVTALSNVERSGRHQLDLVNDLLDLSKIEAGRFEPAVETFSLVDTSNEVIQMLRPRARKHGVRLRLSLDGEVDTLSSDPRRVRQMMLNLLGNAIKFTPEGGRIGLDLKCVGVEIRISIWDTGIGIPAEQLERLFQPFTQLDSALSRQHTGTGLGLNLTAKLAEMLGGRVEAESTVGKGSRFTICLPLQGSAGVGSPTEEPVGSPPGAPVLEAPSSSEGSHVLLVDDNPANLGYLKDFLEAKGHRVDLAYSGEEALVLARKGPDIVFMDVQMPEMDGIEAIERLRAEPETRDLYIVSLTALAMDEDRERCLAAGANDYLSKPISLRTLLAVVEDRSD